MKAITSLVAVLLLAGCGDDTFPKYVDLGGLRILALKSESGGFAEVSPGDTVTITPYISDYRASRTLSAEWQACPDPGVALGVDPSCVGVPGATAATAVAATVPATERTGQTDAFTVSVPTTLLTGRSEQDQYNGISYLVTYKLTASDGATVSGFKRIVVSPASKTTKNRNPTLSGVLADGAALATLPGSEVSLQANIGAGSAESYDVKKRDLSLEGRTEELLTTYFVGGGGTLKLYRTIGTGTTTFTPPSPAPTDAVMVAVLRDGRGGLDVRVIDL